MTDPTYNVGTRRSFGYSLVDSAGNPIDPDFISITIREPDGVLVSKKKPELTNPQVGTWYTDFTFRKIGRHVVTIETGGNVELSDEFFVHTRRRQGFPLGMVVAGTGGANAGGSAPNAFAG